MGSSVPASSLAARAEPALAPSQAHAVFNRRNLAIATGLFLLALVSLVGLQLRFGIPVAGVTAPPHYVYQAESFLHGRWDTDLPLDTPDLVVLNGKRYVPYPPFPAIMLMPFVAIFGLKTSDVLFTALISCCIMPLLYLLFEQLRANGLTKRPWVENLIFSLFAYFGSITLWLSLGGRVWYTAHIVAMALAVLALLLAFRRHYGWAALMVGCATLSRYTAALGFPFFLYLAWQEAGTRQHLETWLASLRARKPDWRAVPWRRLAPVAATVIGVACVLLLRNLAEFGSPLETGYTPLLHQTLPQVKDGLMSLRYVPGNILADFFSFPQVVFNGLTDRHPGLDMLTSRSIAVGVFATSPYFLLLFARNRQISPLRVALWVTVALVVLAMLPYQSVGQTQFGSRYLYEAYPYAFLLLVLSDVRVDWRFGLLGLLAVIVNELGAHQFWTNIVVHI